MQKYDFIKMSQTGKNVVTGFYKIRITPRLIIIRYVQYIEFNKSNLEFEI